MAPTRFRLRCLAAMLTTIGLSACTADINPQLAQAGGVTAAARAAPAAPVGTEAVRAELRRRLASPLSADDAVVIALMNNRPLRATYFNVGILDDDLASAPAAIAAASDDIERRFVLATIGARTYALASEVDRRKTDELKLDVAAEQLRLAAEVRKAYAAALAAAQIASYTAQAHTATEAALELTRRGTRIGNYPKVNELREQVFHGETTVQLARARQAALGAREELTRKLGLWGDDVAYRLPDRLPDLPATPMEGKDLESIALRQRLDLQAAQIDIVADAREMELSHYDAGALLTGRTRFTALDEVDYFRNGTIRGEAAIRTTRIPIFDRAQSRNDPRMMAFMQALDRYAELGTSVRSQVREAYAGYRTHYDIAKHYRDEILPLRRQIGEETGYRYNGMLASVFELLADAREQIAAVTAAIEAQRDFFTAEAELHLALTTGVASPARAPRPPAGVGAGGGD
jgi:outer membrane protein TolC